MTPEPNTTTFEFRLLPPKGWTDIGEPFFYRELKRGPQYLCRYCGMINEPRVPTYHEPGCPRGSQAADNQTTGENNE
jgi:hypothetical protein